MPSITALPSYANFDRVLQKIGAKMKAWEVHALYLGALTSTNFRLGPQQLLDRILGEDAVMGESTEEANEHLQVIFGYWNGLVAERDAGRVRFAPLLLPESAGKAELLAFVMRRRDELAWYVRGVDAGGDDPIEFGPDGQNLFERLGEASGFLEKYVEFLGGSAAIPTKRECRESRTTVLSLVSTAERIIADLMTVSDAVRREAITTLGANAGRETDDGAQLARPIRVGRNEKCPCGSGKKWKKCCGAASTIQ